MHLRSSASIYDNCYQATPAFRTHRGQRDQEWALEADRPELDIAMRREPPVSSPRAAGDSAVSQSAIVWSLSTLISLPPRYLRLIQRLCIEKWDIDFDGGAGGSVSGCCWRIESCVMVAERMLLEILAPRSARASRWRSWVRSADWGITEQRGDCYPLWIQLVEAQRLRHAQRR